MIRETCMTLHSRLLSWLHCHRGWRSYVKLDRWIIKYFNLFFLILIMFYDLFLLKSISFKEATNLWNAELTNEKVLLFLCGQCFFSLRTLYLRRERGFAFLSDLFKSETGGVNNGPFSLSDGSWWIGKIALWSRGPSTDEAASLRFGERG